MYRRNLRLSPIYLTINSSFRCRIFQCSHGSIFAVHLRVLRTFFLLKKKLRKD